MRQKFVAGNWKMNTDMDQGKELLIEIINAPLESDAQLIVIPPFIHLSKFSQLLSSSEIALGAQNCHQQDTGAFTGEISVPMLRSVGVEYVVLGHSERRTYYFEDSLSISFKVQKVLEHGLRPIYCCGESLHQRKENEHFEIVKSQIKDGLFQLNEMELLNCVIAYEPVWAIGTGVTASPEQAQEIHSHIRKSISEVYSDMVADNVSIIYGGSVNPGNARDLFNCPDIDGALVGGASLNADGFAAIANSL
jgi:triosephosphate isomerase